MKKIIIQKFGGTSLQNRKLRQLAAMHVKQTLDQDFSPVVVVSAMGRFGDPYATDSLLDFATKQFTEISDRNKALLLSCGEIISAVIFAHNLKEIGIDAIPLSGWQAGIETDSHFPNAKVKKVYTTNLLKIIENVQVPVVCGFQGMNENGEITNLGRGGSDTSASVLGNALDASEIRIYTDVQGVKSADPKLIKKAKLIENMNYEEAVELAYKGANVVHPRAVEIAAEKNIPLHIISTISGKNGTLIQQIKSDKSVTGISSKNKIIFIQITPQNSNEFNSGLNIFSLFATSSISVDFIDINTSSISFIIDAEEQKKAIKILTDNNFDFIIRKGLSKISVVGSGMTGQPGIMAKIVSTLHSSNIEIKECTDSRTSISCLIDLKDEKKAVSALHEKFELGTK